MVEGVSKGFEKNLEIIGVGYRAELIGEKLVLKLGFSHTIDFDPEPGIKFELENPNKVKVIGIDKEQVGKVAAQIKKSRPPDAYKGKGVRYAGEKVRIKPGKAGKAVGVKIMAKINARHPGRLGMRVRRKVKVTVRGPARSVRSLNHIYAQVMMTRVDTRLLLPPPWM